MTRSHRPRDRGAFEIAIICAIEVESNAVEGVFDEVWEGDNGFGKARGDYNTYTTGRIGLANVVLVYMPGMGKVESASVTAASLGSFPNIKLGLVVGICGAVPMPPNRRAIFLGDVIISTGVEQYDLGRRFRHGLRTKDTLDDKLGRSTREIRSFLKKLRGFQGGERLRMGTISNLTQLWQDKNFGSYTYPGADADVLFSPDVLHKHSDQDCECAEEKDAICDRAREMSCKELDCGEELQPVRQRSLLVGIDDEGVTPPPPMIHFGKIASGDQVILDAVFRDQSCRRTGVIAFEMEGAGAWDNFPTIIIKGVCDYADSHKNKSWQSYAAAVAAASMKAFMSQWASSDSYKLDMMSTTPAEEAHVSDFDIRRQSTALRGDAFPHKLFRPNSEYEDNEDPYNARAKSLELHGLPHRLSSLLWYLGHTSSAKSMFTMVLVLAVLAFVASIRMPKMSGSSKHSAQHWEEDINSNYPIFAVIGLTGVGKSSFISLLGGVNASDAPPDISAGLEPCTSDVGLYEATVDERPVYFMDTPGFDDNKLSDKEVLQQIYEKLQMLSQGDKLIKGMIYLHDMRQTQIGGLARVSFQRSCSG
ncbi:hypothetical protein PV10_04180 [Exophiala mesophila]|uniref:Nucleoside phosphorylase domain-containing protein n=1 Tax=Exophiala mesophila TaxID=212818 RepID=A0A0D1ZGH7_EXOME|nr:uncharacterized protein PV10_04180 [Exophiala mesophila]KIV92924.1 hypothetical protein PV10_04180 [Exophiala mesophila]